MAPLNGCRSGGELPPPLRYSQLEVPNFKRQNLVSLIPEPPNPKPKTPERATQERSCLSKDLPQAGTGLGLRVAGFRGLNPNSGLYTRAGRETWKLLFRVEGLGI